MGIGAGWPPPKRTCGRLAVQSVHTLLANLLRPSHVCPHRQRFGCKLLQSNLWQRRIVMMSGFFLFTLCERARNRKRRTCCLRCAAVEDGLRGDHVRVLTLYTAFTKTRCFCHYTKDGMKKGWNERRLAPKSVFLNRKNTCSFLLPVCFNINEINRLSHKFSSVSIASFDTGSQTSSHHWTILYVQCLAPLCTHTHAHTHKALSQTPFSSRKRSCLFIISGGRGWSGVEQRSKRINHLRSCCLRTATRHT